VGMGNKSAPTPTGSRLMTFASLSEAIEWVEARWDQQRPAPIRLHRAHATDGALGAPAFTVAFAAALDGSPRSTVTDVRTVACFHPLLGGKEGRDCPECYGHGLKDAKVDRYRYPMTLALSRLSNSLRPRRQPHPYRLILSLADHGWDWRATSRAYDVHPDLMEALLLRALRQLHGRYEEGPVPWIHKSESQQHAEALTA
jgi:hypothetical protein